jgi:hypothetical protein
MVQLDVQPAVQLCGTIAVQRIVPCSEVESRVVGTEPQLIAAVILIATSQGYQTSTTDMEIAAAISDGSLPASLGPVPGHMCNQVGAPRLPPCPVG